MTIVSENVFNSIDRNNKSMTLKLSKEKLKTYPGVSVILLGEAVVDVLYLWGETGFPR